MNPKLLLLGVVAVASIVLISPPAAAQQILRGHVPEAVARMHLQPVGRFSNTNHLALAIGLPLRNREALTNLLQQLYNPASANYHRYLTPEQFTEQFGPTEKDYQAVIAFAQANGLRVATTHPNRVVLDVEGTVGEVEKALHVTLREYQHPVEKRRFRAPDAEPSLDLAVPLLSISGLDDYSLPRPRFQIERSANRQNASPNAGSGPNGGYMGMDFRAAYVPDSTLDGSGQVVGLVQFDGYSGSDITYYKNLAGLPSVTLSNVLIDGATGNPSGSGNEVEVCLDIEMAISMATNLSRVVVYIAPNPSPWEDLLNRMANDNTAKQLSCSWYEPGGAAKPTCDAIFQQMAAQGQSFFSASGDYDAYTGLIDFPSDTPYTTQVGGTTLTTTGPGGAYSSETVWNRDNGIGSGGGISTQYPIPSWQTNINMTANQGSTTMRNIPDVALTAESVYVRANGRDYKVGGTSCSAPLWAGFCALVNQQAVALGLARVGFINPLVDAIGTGTRYTSAFHDITTGNNTSPSSPSQFYAVSGYDLCTGWGTPAGQKLINTLANPVVITPATDFSSVGAMGGPFTVTSQNFSLTNVGTNSLTWTLVNTSLWLNASPTGGTLAPGGPAAVVTLSLNSVASNLVVGAYSATLLFSNLTSGVDQSLQCNVSVISPPAIAQQPVDSEVLEGATVMFSVGVTGGSPLYYQWKFNGTNLIDGGNISGSANANLTVHDASSAYVGSYSAIVTNIAGSATSSNAILTITPSPPIIVQQPTNKIAVIGETVRIAVSAIGSTPRFYQWSFDGTNIINATNTTLTLTNVQLNQTGNYSVLVTNALGSVLSSNAVLTVILPCVPDSFSPFVNGDVMCIAVQADRKILVGGGFSGLGGFNLGRVNSDGIVDTSFHPGANGEVYSLVVQDDGKILVGGSFGTLGGQSCVGIGRLNADGTLDTNFNPGVDGPVNSLALQPDGKILVGGYFTTLGGLSAPYIGRFNADGTLDTAFNSGTSLNPGTSSGVSSLALQPDGKILVGGWFALNGQSGAYLDRLNTDGTLDTTFNLGVTGIDLDSLALQPDGKILVGGYFTTLGGQNRSCIGRLNADGTVDATFNPGADGEAISLAVQADGKILVGGAFATLGGQSRSRIGRLNADGTLDTTFNPGVSSPGYGDVYSLAVQADGKILVGGSFTNLAGLKRSNIGRLTPTAMATQSLTFDGSTIFWQRGGSSPEVWRTFFDGSTNGTSWLPLGSGTRVTGGWQLSGLAWPANASLRARGFVTGGRDSASGWFVETLVAPPLVTNQPSNLRIPVGDTATFAVGAGSFAPPLYYQWLFNGTIIAGATSTTLTLTNVQMAQAGNYAVLVTNSFGSVLSSNAALVVYTVDHFAWNQIPSPRFVNTPIAVTIQAQDSTNGLFTNFAGAAILNTTNGIAVNPSVSGNFVQGAWTGSVVVSQTVSNLVLQANDGLGHLGLANPINVINLPSVEMFYSGNMALLVWPVGYSEFVLETSSSLSPAEWVQVPYAPIQFDDQYLLPLDMTGTNGFYRLRFPGP